MTDEELIQQYNQLKQEQAELNAERQRQVEINRRNYVPTQEDLDFAKKATGVGEEGLLESALIGAGKTFSDIGKGAEQIGTYITGNEKRRAQLEQETADERRLMENIGSPTAALVGEIGAGVALPGLGAARIAKGIGGIKGLAAGGAIAGAGYGAVMPTAPGELRSDNILTSAALGGAGGAALPVAGKVLGAVGRKFSSISPTKSAEKTFEKFIGDVPEEQLDAAIMRGQQAQAQGIDLDLGRAIGSERALSNQQELLRGVKNPELVQDYVNTFNHQIDNGLNKMMNSLGEGVPTQQAYKNLQDVAKRAELSIYRDVKNKTTPMYNKLKSEFIPREELGDLIADPVYQDVLAKSLRSVGFKKQAGSLASSSDNLNLYQVELLRQKAKELSNKAFREGDNLDARAYGEVERNLRDVLSNRSQHFDAAISKYADEINAAQDIAGEANIAALVNASPERIQQVSSSIMKLPSNRISALRNLFYNQKGGKEAWNTVVRQNLMDRLDNIQAKEGSNKKLITLMGKPKQAKEIKALVRGNKDAEEIFDVLEYVSTKPTTASASGRGITVRTGGLDALVGAAKDKLFSVHDVRRDRAIVEMLTNPSRYVAEIKRIKKLRAPRSTKRVLIQSYLSQVMATGGVGGGSDEEGQQ